MTLIIKKATFMDSVDLTTQNWQNSKFISLHFYSQRIFFWESMYYIDVIWVFN